MSPLIVQLSGVAFNLSECTHQPSHVHLTNFEGKSNNWRKAKEKKRWLTFIYTSHSFLNDYVRWEQRTISQIYFTAVYAHLIRLVFLTIIFLKMAFVRERLDCFGNFAALKRGKWPLVWRDLECTYQQHQGEFINWKNNYNGLGRHVSQDSRDCFHVALAKRIKMYQQPLIR